MGVYLFIGDSSGRPSLQDMASHGSTGGGVAKEKHFEVLLEAVERMNYLDVHFPQHIL